MSGGLPDSVGDCAGYLLVGRQKGDPLMTSSSVLVALGVMSLILQAAMLLVML